jgi:hypothetical protein
MISRIILFAAGGAALGYGLSRAVGCPDGGCPLTKNPYVSALWGGLIGVMLAVGG